MKSASPRLRVVALAALFVLPAAAAAQIYEWVDAEGRTHFSQDIHQVPAAQRDAARAGASSRRELNRVAPDTQSNRAGRASDGRKMNCAPNGWCSTAKIDPSGGFSSGATPVGTFRVGGRAEGSWRVEHQRREREIADLERRIEQLEAVGADNSPGYQRDNVSDRRYMKYVRRHQAWQDAKRDVVKQREALEEFRESARRSGVPPGWLR